jgi:hypothetical protein
MTNNTLIFTRPAPKKVLGAKSFGVLGVMTARTRCNQCGGSLAGVLGVTKKTPPRLPKLWGELAHNGTTKRPPIPLSPRMAHILRMNGDL